MDITNYLLSFSSDVFKLSLKLLSYMDISTNVTCTLMPQKHQYLSENIKKVEKKCISFFSGASPLNIDLYEKRSRKLLSEMVNIRIQY